MSRKSYSAGVLDEADSVQSRISWVLFKQEQEKILYSGGSSEWKPGDFLFIHPYLRDYEISFGETYADEDDDDDGYQNVRPMAQILYEYAYARCKTCQVNWVEGDECWFCGKTVLVKPGQHFVDVYRQMLTNMQSRTYSSWERVWHSMLGVGSAAERATESMRGLQGLFPRNVVLDEVDLDPNREHPYILYSEADVSLTRLLFDRETMGYPITRLVPIRHAINVFTPVPFQNQEPRLEATEELLWAFRQRRVVEPVVEVGDAVSRQREIERVNAPIDWKSMIAGWERSYDRRRDGR